MNLYLYCDTEHEKDRTDSWQEFDFFSFHSVHLRFSRIFFRFYIAPKDTKRNCILFITLSNAMLLLRRHTKIQRLINLSTYVSFKKRLYDDIIEHRKIVLKHFRFCMYVLLLMYYISFIWFIVIEYQSSLFCCSLVIKKTSSGLIYF